MRWRILLAAMIASIFIAACSDDAPALPDFDCSENAPATGDLKADIVTQWTWIHNASTQYLTFRDNGTAVRTWTSNEDDEISHTTHEYSIDGKLVAIRDYGAYEFTLTDDLWTVADTSADTDWIRCRPTT